MGSEPILFVYVELGGDYGTVKFGDKETSSEVGKILEVSNLTVDKRQDGIGMVSNLTVKVDDSDQLYRQSINRVNWIGKSVTVYHQFEGAEKLQILKAKVSTPFFWNDDDRTLTFDIVVDNTGEDVGCITDDGKNVPIVFGTVVDLEVPIGVEPVYGKLLDPVTVVDVSTIAVNGGTFKVENGENFPQNETITIILGSEHKLKGYFEGNIFHTEDYVVDNFIVKGISNKSRVGYRGEVPICLRINYTTKSLVGNQIFVNQDMTKGLAITESGITPQSYFVISQRIITWLFESEKQVELELDRPIAGALIDLTGGFLYPPAEGSLVTVRPSLKFFAPGTPVHIEGKSEQVYFINCESSIDEILSVKAYKKFGNKNNLVEVPEDYYTVNHAYILNDHTYTAIIVEKPLSVIDDSWEDTLYVSMRSNVGPNIGDIMKWVIENYTDFGIDNASFANYRVDIEKYPANFALLTRKEAFSFLSEICFQARSILYLDSNNVFFKYLSKEPATLRDIRDSDIIEGSQIVELTPFEEIVTSLEGTFRVNYSPETKEEKVVFKNNEAIYGYKKEDIDFYIFNSRELVQKSITFWGNRKSNQWLRSKFDTFLTTLGIEFYDCIQLRGELLDTKAIVENLSFDSSVPTKVSYELWTPILSGTNEQATVAWLSDADDVQPNTPVVEKGDPANTSLEFVLQEFLDPFYNGTKNAKVYTIGEDLGDGYHSASSLDEKGNESGDIVKEVNGESLETGSTVVGTKINNEIIVQKGGGLSTLSVETSAGTAINNGLTGVDERTAKLDQVLRLLSNNQPGLNLTGLYIIDPVTSLAVPLSNVFQVVAGELCLKLGSLKLTDGTNKGLLSLQYDSGSGKFYPTSTFLEA